MDVSLHLTVPELSIDKTIISTVTFDDSFLAGTESERQNRIKNCIDKILEVVLTRFSTMPYLADFELYFGWLDDIS